MMPTGITVIVSAFFALIGIIISKENKVSEFRQKWIDELRVEISTIVAYSLKITAVTSIIVEINNKIGLAEQRLNSVKNTQAGLVPQQTPPDYHQKLLEQEVKQEQDELKELKKCKMERIKELEDQFLITGQTMTSIKLRMNKEDEFLLQLRKFDDSFTVLHLAILNPNWNGWTNPIASNELTNFSREMGQFTEISKKLLKSEWERVKGGEKVFSWTIKGLVGALVIIAISELPFRKIIRIYDCLSQPEVALNVQTKENPPPETKPEPINTK